MVVRTDDWMHGWVSVGVGCLLVVAWAYGRLIHARGPLPIGLRALRHARGPAGLLPTNNQHTYLPKHASNHPSIQPLVRTLTHTSIYPPIHSPPYPFIHPHNPSPTHPTT